MKRIVLSLVIILAVVGMATGATRALFSAQDEISGNTIASGSVDLVVHNFSGNKPINTQNMVPGQWTDWGRAELYNTGSLPVNVYMYVDNVSGGACDKTNLEVRTGWAGGDEKVRQVYNGSLASLTGSANRVETTIDPPFDQLNSNWSQVIWQHAQLDGSADNAYQNTTCTWREVFVAENLVP